MREFHPDIVFVDMSMPVMDGCTFCRRHIRNSPTASISLSAAMTISLMPSMLFRNGACDYLLKPVDEENLNCAIEKAVKAINPNVSFNSSASDGNAAHTTPDEIITVIKAYLESNYCTNIHISMFAEKYFFSQEYLNKLFKTNTASPSTSMY